MIDQTGTPTILELLTLYLQGQNAVVVKLEQSLCVTIPLSLLDTTAPQQGMLPVLTDLAPGQRVIVSRGAVTLLLDALQSTLKPMQSSGPDENAPSEQPST